MTIQISSHPDVAVRRQKSWMKAIFIHFGGERLAPVDDKVQVKLQSEAGEACGTSGIRAQFASENWFAKVDHGGMNQSLTEFKLGEMIDEKDKKFFTIPAAFLAIKFVEVNGHEVSPPAFCPPKFLQIVITAREQFYTQSRAMREGATYEDIRAAERLIENLKQKYMLSSDWGDEQWKMKFDGQAWHPIIHDFGFSGMAKSTYKEVNNLDHRLILHDSGW